jgi:hypothetical protein
MIVLRILVAVLVLAVFACPAFASSFTSYTDQTAFNIATAGLYFPNSGTPVPITFTGALINSGAEYDDSTTLASFFAFRSDATTVDQFTKVGTSLQTTAGLGDTVKITLPANTYAFAVNFTVPSSFGTFCMEPTDTFNTTTNCTYTATAFSPNSTFFGIVSTTPFQTFWVGPSSGVAPTLILNSFEVGTQAAVADTPEVATLLAIGSGLILLYLLHRRRPRLA